MWIQRKPTMDINYPEMYLQILFNTALVKWLVEVIKLKMKSGLSRCDFCLYWDFKSSAELLFGRLGPGQFKQLYPQIGCWCRIYHVNIIYKNFCTQA